MDGAKQVFKTTFVRRTSIVCVALALISTVALSGCIGTAAQLMYILKGNKAKAAYSGLEKKRVAVVCISDASSHGPDSLTKTLAKSLGMQLAVNVKKIQVVPNDEVEDWKDKHGWDDIDLIKLGKDLEADAVVALELTGYSIREGSTVFKGRAQITTTVYDMTNEGNVSFVQGPEQFVFPKTHARPAIGTTAAEFESAYMNRIVAYISRLFYDYEKAEAFGEDAVLF